ncbi:hypothetical protein LG21E20_19740 (plasmid) [Lactococcus formosensis]|nr:hypothetical protein LG21E20_19740 [Lactococcus formosensis]
MRVNVTNTKISILQSCVTVLVLFFSTKSNFSLGYFILGSFVACSGIFLGNYLKTKKSKK